MSSNKREEKLSIGARLREERKRLRMTQADFAQVAGLSRVTQRYYENDERSPDAEYLAAVAAIGVDVQYVITGQRSGLAASLASDEAALLDNYRHSSDEGRASMRTVSSALAKSPVSDGDVEDGGG